MQNAFLLKMRVSNCMIYFDFLINFAIGAIVWLGNNRGEGSSEIFKSYLVGSIFERVDIRGRANMKYFVLFCPYDSGTHS
jgi:hypothetical protein